MAEEAVNLTTAEEEQEIPEHIPVLPLHQGVLFPELTVPLLVSRPDHINLIDEALVKDRALVAVAQRDDTVDPHSAGSRKSKSQCVQGSYEGP